MVNNTADDIIGELVNDKKKDIKMEELALGMELDADREVLNASLLSWFLTFCL